MGGLAVQRGARRPHLLARLVHDAHELVAQRVGVHVAQLRELGGLDRGVELHVRPDARKELLLPHLSEEEPQLTLVRLVRVEALDVVIVGRRGSDKLRACVRKQLLEAQILPALEPRLLLAVLVPDRLLQRLVDLPRAQRQGDQHEGVHLILLLHHRVVLIRQGVDARRFRQEDENLAKGADGVGVAPHHEVSEAHVVIKRDMARRDPVVQRHLFGNINALDRLHCEVVVPEEAVHAQ
mmetsp:Transcript_18541/g.37310  ORF Transcript_18541/g.37310 Transcript_18541/m.37310 type:complete len:238 (-) Transcript_18541:42-755(-)